MVVLLVATSSGNCNGRQPAAPSAPPVPARPVIVVTSGITGAPLAGAEVRTTAGIVRTDPSGRVELPIGTGIGASIDIVFPGFLDRQTTLVSELDRHALWPRSLEPGLGESFTTFLTYTGSRTPDEPGQAPLRRLVPAASTVEIYIAPDIRTATNEAAHRWAIDQANAATRGLPQFILVHTPPSPQAASFEVRIDGTHPDCATSDAIYSVTFVSSFNARETWNGVVTYCDAASAENPGLATHELGHSLGLYHSERNIDMMWPFTRGKSAFTTAEILSVRLAYQRRGGNTFPDSDRGLFAFAHGSARSPVSGTDLPLSIRCGDGRP